MEVPQQIEPEYQVNLEQRTKSTPPPNPPTIVVNNPNELDIPALNIDINVETSSVYGRQGGSFGGGGLASIREMDIKLTDFGYTEQVEGTLKGSLFDTKVDPNGKATRIKVLIGEAPGGGFGCVLRYHPAL